MTTKSNAAGKPRRASLEDLRKKPSRNREVTIATIGDDGEDAELTMVFRAVSYKAYDALLTANQPTKEQVRDGESNWNPDTFPPALIAACAVDPPLDIAAAQELWTSEEWSRGELMDLFYAVVKLNVEGLDIPFTGRGSGPTRPSR